MDHEHLFNLHTIIKKDSADILFFIRKLIEGKEHKSYKHPHGFYVTLLHDDGEVQWRLHIWKKGVKKKTNIHAKIHSHDKNLFSKILRGSISNQLYDVRRYYDGSSLECAELYRAAYKGDKYNPSTEIELKSDGEKIYFKKSGIDEYCINEYYYIAAQQFHEAVIADDITTITLVCMYGRSIDVPYILVDSSAPSEVNFTREKVDVEEILSII